MNEIGWKKPQMMDGGHKLGKLHHEYPFKWGWLTLSSSSPLPCENDSSSLIFPIFSREAGNLDWKARFLCKI